MLSPYYTPTRVTFGENAEENVGKEIKRENAKCVLIHYGSSRTEKSGLLDKIRSLIEKEGIKTVCLGGVKPNPRLNLVRTGIELAKKEGVDFILALGGGSVIDSAKAIGYGLYNSNIDVWDIYDKKAEAEGCTPLGVILTLSATGSEMSDSSVITNEDGGLKRGYNNDKSRARFALLNPVLTYTVPRYQTEAGSVDIAMHTIERFFHAGEGISITDEIAGALVKNVFEKALICIDDPENYEARASLMWASSISHNGLMAVGNDQRGDWACHNMEHELSGMFDIAHGAGLAILFPHWSRYVYKEKPERFALLGKLVFGIEEKGEEGALKTIAAFENVFKALEMPLSLKDAGISVSDEQIDEMVWKATLGHRRTLGAFKMLSDDDMRAIFKAAR